MPRAQSQLAFPSRLYPAGRDLERRTSRAAATAERDRSSFAPRRIKETTLIVGASVFSALAFNGAFFSRVFGSYGIGSGYAVFDASLLLILVALNLVVFSLLGSKLTTKPVIVVLQVASAISSYFMGAYGIMVDDDMMRNAVETNAAETLDLISMPLVLHVLLLGVLPSWFVLRLSVEYGSLWRGALRRLALAVLSLLLIAALLFGSGPTFASFFREHKPMRFFCNPATYLVATFHLVRDRGAEDAPLRTIAPDARRAESESRKLVVFVVGETARADRFSLNGYERDTNPLLRNEDVISFRNVEASGTSTATAVPLMFSHMGRKHPDADAVRSTENVLDVLARVGVSVLWRDNNSSSKGVADRVEYENFKDPALNPIVDGEPRDEGMLAGLQEYIDAREGDVFIVLHQMGSHGPAYSTRYPTGFEVFHPACHSNLLDRCDRGDLDNAYDNTIVYTDYFLTRVIELLGNNDDRFETALLYFGDHGESLGENGMYLHGYPFALAPDEQTHVPAILWFGTRSDVDRETLRARVDDPYSHDNIFHTVLGLFAVETELYDANADMLAGARNTLKHRAP